MGCTGSVDQKFSFRKKLSAFSNKTVKRQRPTGKELPYNPTDLGMLIAKGKTQKVNKILNEY
jgi:hypothetical protein